MPIVAFGINHKTAPVDIREKVAFSQERMDEALKDLVACPAVNEAAILSTCNRTEIYCGLEQFNDEQLISWLANFHGLEADQIRSYTYMHHDNSAVQHLFRVASGLDSLVLGEPQILGQIKDTFAKANECGTTARLLSRLFQHTFNVAKQVRTDTAIGSSPVSVAFAAVSLAKQIFSHFESHTAMVIGAGETIELVARHLKENGLGRIIVANRTVERAHTIAQQFDGYAIALEEIPAHLAEADIIISSTASPLPILGKGAVESAIKARKRKPMLMVDIAVPRDIEGQVGELEDVYLYTVDDLQEIIQEGLKSRQEAAQQAEEIIEVQVTHFMGWLRSLSSISIIREFRESAMTIQQNELEKATAKLQSGSDAEQVLKQLAHSLTNKLIHAPTSQIRQATHDGNQELLSAACTLFELNNPK
ncbi:Glutamyl-tRNA reductase [hydrothermal vent metagenome]|uniref:glutamyl-tRNA reductase n=1 Tax=hydrothermal vent metagenome TaxID=652676 RepID=A0A3B0ZZZ2_9ZZZZ